MDATKELKVRVPMRLVVRLYHVKLLQSRPISDVVNQALNEFFAAHGQAFAASQPGENGSSASADDSAEGGAQELAGILRERLFASATRPRTLPQ